MYIDSLSLTWYLVGAESKILKQSKYYFLIEKKIRRCGQTKNIVLILIWLIHMSVYLRLVKQLFLIQRYFMTFMFVYSVEKLESNFIITYHARWALRDNSMSRICI